jgi:cell division protein FtsL
MNQNGEMCRLRRKKTMISRGDLVFVVMFAVTVAGVACAASYMDGNRTQIEIAKIQAGCKP